MSRGSGSADPAGDERTPGWVYVAGLAVIALALVFVVLHLSGGAIPQH
jgi:hypothetical protein